MRIALVTVMLLGAAACGGDSYRWYCNELNTSPSTWRLVPECGEAPFVLRADLRDPQSCGSGCTCTVSAWRYTSEFVHDVFGYQAEGCAAVATCSLAGAAVQIQLSTTGPQMIGQADDANGSSLCFYSATPEAP